MGEYYTDFDVESGCWGVFHTEGDGYCHALYSSEDEALMHVDLMNGVDICVQTLLMMWEIMT